MPKLSPGLLLSANLPQVRAQSRPTSPTVVGEQPLPAGTRVLVQQLVAKPEYNGMLACVLSFDEGKGRYRVALDDGQEVSLKAECVARALAFDVQTRASNSGSVSDVTTGAASAVSKGGGSGLAPSAAGLTARPTSPMCTSPASPTSSTDRSNPRPLPPCTYGLQCYRTNPVHFKEYVFSPLNPSLLLSTHAARQAVLAFEPHQTDRFSHPPGHRPKSPLSTAPFRGSSPTPSSQPASRSTSPACASPSGSVHPTPPDSPTGTPCPRSPTGTPPALNARMPLSHALAQRPTEAPPNCNCGTACK